ncbi:hypothetical protein [Primorskyibacter sp. S87]|uniref:hypothetical protein n=1 Tax=Primorskyibacter sp. S87 TaxID=3415126 RepID=UPI003C7DE769
MAHKLHISGDTVTRRDFADVDQQKALTRAFRDLNNGRTRRDNNDPFNEAFSITPDMWGLLQKTNPELFDSDPRRRHKAWKAFANTSEGRALRVK